MPHSARLAVSLASHRSPRRVSLEPARATRELCRTLELPYPPVVESPLCCSPTVSHAQPSSVPAPPRRSWSWLRLFCRLRLLDARLKKSPHQVPCCPSLLLTATASPSHRRRSSPVDSRSASHVCADRAQFIGACPDFPVLHRDPRRCRRPRVPASDPLRPPVVSVYARQTSIPR
jgi:hypothetical protein